MKFNINIEKKHLYYLTFLVSLLLIGFVIADGWDPADAYHSTLFTDTITSQTEGNAVKITDTQGLEVTGTDGLSVTNKITTTDLTVSAAFTNKRTYTYYQKKRTCWDCGEDQESNFGQHDFCWSLGSGVRERGAGSEWWKCYLIPTETSGGSELADGTVVLKNPGQKLYWKLYYGSENSQRDDEEVYCKIMCVDFE